MTNCDVAIIGAGPYGLSIAAHLKARGVAFRIFGTPMSFWRDHMPKGMHLKSEGFASSLYDPGSTFTLEVYCKEKGIPYAHTGNPVPLEVFTAYGLEFQRRFVPELEIRSVNLLQRTAEGFRIRLDDGETFTSRRVVVAVGLTHFEYMPPMLAVLPEEFITHSAQHHELDRFKGHDVAIVGAGASALDLAALLHQAGAHVEVIARKSVIRFHDPPEKTEPSLLDRLRAPVTGIGPGWKLFLCTNAPLIFRQMPQEFRLEKVKQILGPAPCWFTKEQVVGKVGLNVGVNVTEAKAENGRVKLQLTDNSGMRKTLTADHVIAATGYKVDLRRLAFIDPDIQSRLQTVKHTPVLSSNFESSVPGMYFVGITSANTFGPLLRFAFGAGFASRRLSRHLAKTAERKSVVGESLTKAETAEPDKVEVR
jgi:thioredoxin reductase